MTREDFYPFLLRLNRSIAANLIDIACLDLYSSLFDSYKTYRWRYVHPGLPIEKVESRSRNSGTTLHVWRKLRLRGYKRGFLD